MGECRSRTVYMSRHGFQAACTCQRQDRRCQTDSRRLQRPTENAPCPRERLKDTTFVAHSHCAISTLQALGSVMPANAAGPDQLSSPCCHQWFYTTFIWNQYPSLQNVHCIQCFRKPDAGHQCRLCDAAMCRICYWVDRCKRQALQGLRARHC